MGNWESYYEFVKSRHESMMNCIKILIGFLVVIAIMLISFLISLLVQNY